VAANEATSGLCKQKLGRSVKPGYANQGRRGAGFQVGGTFGVTAGADVTVNCAKDAYENSGDTFRDGSQAIAERVQGKPAERDVYHGAS
jgi:hypothetical protein